MRERPARNIRFERGFAMSRTEITVGEFRRFVQRQRLPRARDAARLFDGVRRAQRQLRAPRQRRLAVRLRRQPRRATRCRWCMSAPRTRRPTREWLSAADRPALSAAERGRVRIRAARRQRRALIRGAMASPPAQHGQLHRRHRTNRRAGGAGAMPSPATATAPGARRRWALRGQCIRPSRPGRQCQRMGRRLLARQLPACAHATAKPGSIPVAAQRVVRGGSWASSPAQTRSAWRMSARGQHHQRAHRVSGVRALISDEGVGR